MQSAMVERTIPLHPSQWNGTAIRRRKYLGKAKQCRNVSEHTTVNRHLERISDEVRADAAQAA